MLPEFLSRPDRYSFLYLCKVQNFDGNSQKLAEVLVDWADESKLIAGFDRLSWSEMSSGQMPSELYTFNFYGSKNQCDVLEGVLVLISTKDLGEFPEYLELISKISIVASPQVEGDIAEPFEVDEEFAGAYYGCLFNWESPDVKRAFPDGVKVVQLSPVCSLLLGKSLYSVDDWIEDFFNKDESAGIKSANYLLFPEKEKVLNLKEMVSDKEKIHLDSEIKGIHC